jgi:hypothetical protein
LRRFRGFTFTCIDPFLLSEGGGENNAKILRLRISDSRSAQSAGSLTKAFFDLLRNGMLLGVLKYFAEKTESTFLQWVYLFGLGMLFFAASAFWEVLRYDHSLHF